MESVLNDLLSTKFKIDCSLINRQDTLKDIGIDSLEMVVMVLELEQIIGRNISDKEMMNLQTMGDILSLLEREKTFK
jgi:acyl carrier protein